MASLLEQVIAAHGGLEPWRHSTAIEADVTYGGPYWEVKGVPDFVGTDHVVADTQRQRITLTQPSGRVITYDKQADLVTVEAPGGTIERLAQPRASFAGHTAQDPWSVAQAGYFRGYATWSYLVEPYLFVHPGVTTAETEPWVEDGERWRGLSVTFPDTLDVHHRTQVYHFDDTGVQRRIDYEPDITGGPAIAHYDTGHEKFGDVLVTTRRQIFVRDVDGTPDRSWMPIGIDVRGVHLH